MFITWKTWHSLWENKTKQRFQKCVPTLWALFSFEKAEAEIGKWAVTANISRHMLLENNIGFTLMQGSYCEGQDSDANDVYLWKICVLKSLRTWIKWVVDEDRNKASIKKYEWLHTTKDETQDLRKAPHAIHFLNWMESTERSWGAGSWEGKSSLHWATQSSLHK